MLTAQKIEAFLSDDGKRIVGDIAWERAPGDHPALNFRKEIVSTSGYAVQVHGWYNSSNGKLTYTLFHGKDGRIYGLDLGKGHENPTGEQVGDKHKHRWTPATTDKAAYVPDDITEPWHRPVAVWRQFCAEARIRHEGTMSPPDEEEEVTL